MATTEHASFHVYLCSCLLQLRVMSSDARLICCCPVCCSGLIPFCGSPHWLARVSSDIAFCAAQSFAKAPDLIAPFPQGVAHYARNSVATNRALAALLWRIASPDGLDLEPMLYQVRVGRCASGTMRTCIRNHVHVPPKPLKTSPKPCCSAWISHLLLAPLICVAIHTEARSLFLIPDS